MFIVNQNLQMRSARGLLFEFIAKLRQQLKIVLKLLNPESVFEVPEVLSESESESVEGRSITLIQSCFLRFRVLT